MLVRRAPTVQSASQMQQFHGVKGIVVGPERPGRREENGLAGFPVLSSPTTIRPDSLLPAWSS